MHRRRIARSLAGAVVVSTSLVLVLAGPAQARWGVYSVHAKVSSGRYLDRESVTRRVHPGQRAVFDFSLGRTGQRRGMLRVTGCDGSERFDLEYSRLTDDGAVRVTGAIRSDEGLLTGAGYYVHVTVRLTVHVADDVAPGSVKQCDVTASSLTKHQTATAVVAVV